MSRTPRASSCALVENLLREDLNPIEEAEAYQRLLAEFAWTQEELAERVSKDRSTISNCLRLLKLPETIQADLRGGRLTMGHARALLSLTSPAEQLRLREQILAHSWSVRATEEGVQKKRAILPHRAARRSPELTALEDALPRGAGHAGAPRRQRSARPDRDRLHVTRGSRSARRDPHHAPLSAASAMAERLVVGLSGGVDSSVAAALLVEQGFDVVGVTLRVWPWREPEQGSQRFGSCCSPEAVDAARAVARQLGIPYYLLNSEREFDEAVIAPFAREYAEGRTPVPCVACNRRVKFGSLLARARAWDAVAVATGHYARITRDPTTGRFLLWRGRDARKDQSDFLWPLSQDQLGAARFPVGDLAKDEVRARARALDLATADTPESQEICFIPDHDYRGFLRRRVPEAFREGPSWTGRGGRSAGTEASPTSPWASGVGWGSPRGGPST